MVKQATKKAKEPKKKQVLFPRINSSAVALKVARDAAISGLVFAGMVALGVVFILWTGISPTDKSAVVGDDRAYEIVGGVIEVSLILLAAWRIYLGKGYVSAALLTALFLLEITMKVVGGTANPGWCIFYFYVCASMLNGLRATWYLRNNAKASMSAENALQRLVTR